MIVRETRHILASFVDMTSFLSILPLPSESKRMYASRMMRRAFIRRAPWGSRWRGEEGDSSSAPIAAAGGGGGVEACVGLLVLAAAAVAVVGLRAVAAAAAAAAAAAWIGRGGTWFAAPGTALRCAAAAATTAAGCGGALALATALAVVVREALLSDV